MRRSKPYKEDFLDRLKDVEYAIAYLNAAIEDDDHRVFWLALGDVVTASGGMTDLSKAKILKKVNFWRVLSFKYYLEFKTLRNFLSFLGYKISITRIGGPLCNIHQNSSHSHSQRASKRRDSATRKRDATSSKSRNTTRLTGGSS